jgi:hypothetical protein
LGWQSAVIADIARSLWLPMRWPPGGVTTTVVPVPGGHTNDPFYIIHRYRDAGYQ